MKKPKMTDRELNSFWIKEHLRKLAKPVRQAAKRSNSGYEDVNDKCPNCGPLGNDFCTWEGHNKVWER
jgi:hypothetical protein